MVSAGVLWLCFEGPEKDKVTLLLQRYVIVDEKKSYCDTVVPQCSLLIRSRTRVECRNQRVPDDEALSLSGRCQELHEFYQVRRVPSKRSGLKHFFLIKMQ